MKNIYTLFMPEPEMQASMEKEVNEFEKNFKDDPRFLSGWGHAYFCPEDGARLIFDINKPHEHKCSICGKVYKGFILDGCHITMVRNLAAVTCLKAAILYRLTQDLKYVDTIKNIINFYADNYESMAIHAKDHITNQSTLDVGGAGKIMPQGLNESILITRMLTSMELVREHLDDEFLNSVKEKLFIPASKLLIPQKMHIHNIPCWINSALGMIGLFFNEKSLIDEATVNPFNINEQVENGVTDAGFWYEGSIHYNFFTLEGIMNLLAFCKYYDFSMPEITKNKIKGMLFSAYNYAFDNLAFPNPSDGWPNVGLKTYSYVYYIGYAVFGDEILPLLKAIENGNEPRQSVPLSEPYYFKNEIPIERILYGPNREVKTMPINMLEKRKSANMESYNCAVLRNDTYNVFFKYGHQIRSHAHPDKMNVEVMINNQSFTRDLSNSGYTSKLCNQWHRRNIAHTTCMVNGIESDIENPGKLISFKNNFVKSKAIVQPGVQFVRSLMIDSKKLEDIFEVECDKNSQIDWFYHFNQPLDISKLDLDQVTPLPEYPYFFDCQKINVKEKLHLDTPIASIIINLQPDMECYVAKTYANPANKMRSSLVIRRYNSKALFQMEVEAK